MKYFFKELSPFILTTLLFFFTCSIFILSFEKIELHLFLNQFHSPFFDWFFKTYTHIGDGIFPAVAIPLVLIFYRKNILTNFLTGAVTFLLVPASVQFFKRIVFAKSPRPVRVIGEDVLYLIPDVEMAHIHSFPSGHSATTFALFILLAYIFRNNKGLQITFGVCAIIGAYSRVYLSQHFVQDIFAGSFLGVTCFFIACALLSYPLSKLDSKHK
ncbi:phosphatase PAP2 family protein [Reichenbachiella sp. MALMAid0571]|uniref:phosphatase PAP2 family protein n=1 Tax=Reichenbachiella sp. MALMAid0571 TaxID=3143939 RepID=UPI0032E03705